MNRKFGVDWLTLEIQPPTLTLLEIGDLTTDRFRGIFRLGYQGDAWIEVRCRVQANPLSHNPHLDSSSTLPMSTPLLASQPLLVPMTLRLSSLNLRAILILVVSKAKGITLVFKNDPLQNVDVSSTFDSIEVIRGYLQQEIEGQLKELFREDLPGIIHRLSQKWFGGAGMSGKVEMPYRHETVKIDPSDPHTPLPSNQPDSGLSRTDYFDGLDEGESLAPDDSISVSPSRRLRTANIRKRGQQTSINESPNAYTTFPEIENYDPTYGLRPEGVPSHSGYEAFGRLWEDPQRSKSKGLGSLMSLAEEITFVEADEADPDDLDDYLDDVESVMVDSDDGNQSVNDIDDFTSQTRRKLFERGRGSTVLSHKDPFMNGRRPAAGDSKSYGSPSDTAFALRASRPRIYHAQSQIRAPSEVGHSKQWSYDPDSPAATIRATAGNKTARASSVRSSAGGSSVGLGMARSLLQGNPDSNSRRIWPDRLIPPQFRPVISSQPAGTGAAKSHLDRIQSRTETTPITQVPPRIERGPSMMQNVVSRSSAASSAGPPQQRPDRAALASRPRPLSVQAPPAQRTVTPPRMRRSSGQYPHSISGSPPGPNFIGSGNPSRFNNIILPLNDSVSQLASLSHSNHTLSPYARSHEHIAVRSFPYLSRSNSLVGTNHGLPSSMTITQTGFAHVPQSGTQTPGMEHNHKTRATRKRLFRLRPANDETPNDGSPKLSPEEAGRTIPQEIAPTPMLRTTSAAHYNTLQRPVLTSRGSYGFPSSDL